jgi:hypothetical protein
MNITVHMCSRGRPLQLVAALTSLQQNASGKHNVRYGVAVDVDDLATIGVCQTLRPTWPQGSGFRVGPRPVSMDALHNQLARDIPGEVYVGFCDDMLCVTKDWDAEIAKLVKENPNGVWWWSSNREGEFTQMPIVSEAWRKAAGGIFPEYFPYWWGDTWLAEVYVLATESHLQYAPVFFIDGAETTNNMRELRFWTEFYHWLQPVRIEEARRISEALGFPALTVTDLFSKFTGIKNKKFMDRIEEIEAGQGDRGDPHEGYKIAKARAEEMLRTYTLPKPRQEIDLTDLLTPEVTKILQDAFPGLDPI